MHGEETPETGKLLPARLWSVKENMEALITQEELSLEALQTDKGRPTIEAKCNEDYIIRRMT